MADVRVALQDIKEDSESGTLILLAGAAALLLRLVEHSCITAALAARTSC
jgi:hypothetical protein